MPDLSAISAMLGAGLPATFTFLYQRLENLLDRRGEPETDLAAPDVLRGELRLPLTADHNTLAKRQENLETLRDVLDAYRYAPERINVDDIRLLRMLGRVRGTLEEIYEQRLTFVGEEDRDPSGPSARQKIGTLRGKATAVDSDVVAGPVETSQDAVTVEEGGEMTGIRARYIGPPPATR
ncbi:hypothetical protein [Streptomyces sp. NBC_01727]|uniref:hypothetical protein n=1 Tax=Streptomyces sp. NBC_01727 TaxID=2975924 RepID=UPI002E122342|nr:hypothetical protein OIE76_00055 [Streptomyces sp. NBC_01727]WSG85631.1 hypothetical protein OIE76_40275 [Streptomyces sp. NBC_01727]